MPCIYSNLGLKTQRERSTDNYNHDHVPRRKKKRNAIDRPGTWMDMDQVEQHIANQAAKKITRRHDEPLTCIR